MEMLLKKNPTGHLRLLSLEHVWLRLSVVEARFDQIEERRKEG
jgi:hypothetical protein